MNSLPCLFARECEIKNNFPEMRIWIWQPVRVDLKTDTLSIMCLKETGLHAEENC